MLIPGGRFPRASISSKPGVDERTQVGHLQLAADGGCAFSKSVWASAAKSFTSRLGEVAAFTSWTPVRSY
ncbi:hypothetical protein, partial [Salinispora arenicola]|uniref:hypothetical protein n=1 Tax=Salinispora arenicola TaxID=168697 RepID=UPI0027DC7557